MIGTAQNVGSLQESSVLCKLFCPDPLFHVQMQVSFISDSGSLHGISHAQFILLLSPAEVMSSVTLEWTKKQQELLSEKQTDWGKESEMK